MSEREPTLRRTPSALWRLAADEVVVAIPGRTEIDRLIGPAATAWALLEDPRTVADLVDNLAEIYSTTPERIAPEVKSVLRELVQRGSLQELGSD